MHTKMYSSTSMMSILKTSIFKKKIPVKVEMKLICSLFLTFFLVFIFGVNVQCHTVLEVTYIMYNAP